MTNHILFKGLTVLGFCEALPPMGINGWIEAIASHGYTAHEKTILTCADSLGKIIVNHTADFKNAVNK